MSNPSDCTSASQSPALAAIVARYRQLLTAWNERDAAQFVTLFAADGHVIGFDGGLMDGSTEIEASLRPIFARHSTAAYVSTLRGVAQLAPDVALLRAVAGMVPLGGADLNGAVNAIQTFVARKQDGAWYITLYQNTPAAFHGRPELVERMTQEPLKAQTSGANEAMRTN